MSNKLYLPCPQLHLTNSNHVELIKKILLATKDNTLPQLEDDEYFGAGVILDIIAKAEQNSVVQQWTIDSDPLGR